LSCALQACMREGIAASSDFGESVAPEVRDLLLCRSRLGESVALAMLGGRMRKSRGYLELEGKGLHALRARSTTATRHSHPYGSHLVETP